MNLRRNPSSLLPCRRPSLGNAMPKATKHGGTTRPTQSSPCPRRVPLTTFQDSPHRSRDPGYLSAHLNLKNRPKEKSSPPVLQVVGIEARETENEILEWGSGPLEVGDAVEIRILDEGARDAPLKRKKSSESPKNLLSQRDLAEEVVSIVADFDKRLVELVKKAKEQEPPYHYNFPCSSATKNEVVSN